MVKPINVAIGDVITQVYHGPIEPSPWSTFIRTLRRTVGCDGATLALFQDGSDDPVVLAQDREGYPQVERPIPPARSNTLDNAYVLSMKGVPADRIRDYYQRLLRRGNVEYVLSFCLAELEGLTCQVWLENGRAHGEFNELPTQVLTYLRAPFEHALGMYAMTQRYGIFRQRSTNRVLSGCLRTPT
jgi:hypothetical protein